MATETGEVIHLLDPLNCEPLRQAYRKLWSEPKNVRFRKVLRLSTQDYAWVTQGGADPLPEMDA